MKTKLMWASGAVLVTAILGTATLVWCTAADLQLFPQQEVALHNLDGQGLILDIGGSGEGVIGRLMGDRVVAIDISREELQDAPPGTVKIVMDAREMIFLDNSFQMATSFCTFMSITDQEGQKQVLSEVLRVLKPGGRFLIWDIEVPSVHDEDKSTAVFPMRIDLPDDALRTSYGVTWPREAHDLAYYSRLAVLTGFEIADRKQNDRVMTLELVKPSPEDEEATPAEHDHHEHTDGAAMQIMPRHQVTLAELPGTGAILDIGGGGEGVIGRLDENRVLAIDISRPELELAPGAPVKAVMNALDMGFVTGSVTDVTAFYTLMYFDADDLDQLFEEVGRVLATGGHFWIWDVELQPCQEGRTVVAYPLSVILPKETIRTGYGTACPENERSIETYQRLAAENGFRVVRHRAAAPAIFLELEAL